MFPSPLCNIKKKKKGEEDDENMEQEGEEASEGWEDNKLSLWERNLSKCDARKKKR